MNTSTSSPWFQPLSSLSRGKKTKTIESLEAAGFHSLFDLLSITPLRLERVPSVSSFKNAHIDEHFRGVGKVLNIRKNQNFRVFGKGRTPLSNITIVVEDRFQSGAILQLKWFNCYPSLAKKLNSLEFITFSGKVSFYQSNLQITNPEYLEIDQSTFNQDLTYWSEINPEETLIVYPTVNSVSPTHLKKLFQKISPSLWSEVPETIPEDILNRHNFLNIQETFQTLHGKKGVPSEDQKLKATERLIFEDFFNNQVKIKYRKSIINEKKGLPHKVSKDKLQEYISLFPYKLTSDQEKVTNDILKDLQASSPMMRMIQGDVGSGKTSVAFLAAMTSIDNGYQAALMCPTESLALQHFLTIHDLLKDHDIRVGLLVGSMKKKEKESLYENLENGHIQFVIGTHALFQESVQFKKLGIAIIDEQHKFGVNQRIRLVEKTQGAHCLIMTATPIPRSLSLTQYGDLDISSIRSMPQGRKGIKTKIVHPKDFEKFLVFIKTRVSMGEQVYIVVPAIEESISKDILNLEETLKRFEHFFPDLKIQGLHGQLKAQEKNQVFLDFKEHKIDILISTSVIEVGINVPNATTMAILSPERFGLSSLHQLRGRVGRGEKPGFCFLVLDKKISADSMERLQVIEQTTDGFKIAEEDLKMRGEGDIFGVEQSGSTKQDLASLLTHSYLLEIAVSEVEKLYQNQDPFLIKKIEELKNDPHLSKTI